MDNQTLLYELQLSMHNKLLGVIIIGFGLLALFSEQEYSWIISALAVGIGTGLVILKPKKDNVEK